MKNTKSRVRFAVVGLGHIAQVAVLPAFRHAKAKAELSALVTGSEKKAKVLSKKYKVEAYSYDHYSEILKSGKVDAVYIATPNELHTDFVCEALENGIHVLCEKPLATTVEDCLKMIEASRQSGAKLMTAYRLHLDKPNLEAIEICRRGRLGKLKSFLSSFSYVIKDKDNIRMRPIQGSGPLWDIGIYCINAARYLFGENPVEVSGFATRLPEGPFSEVDETVTVVMRFTEDRTATFQCSFNMTESAYFEVYGDKGMIRLENAYEYVEPPVLHSLIKEKRSKKKYKKVDQFAAELEYFAECVQKNKTVEPSGEEGLIDVAIMTAIEDSIRQAKPVTVAYENFDKKAAPTIQMVRQKPPVEKPELIDVKSASGS